MGFDQTGLTIFIDIGTTGAMVPFQSPIMQWRNLGDFWDPPEIRGDDTVIPHRQGVKAGGREIDKTVRVLEGLICGDVDVHNAPYAKASDGLKSNIRYVGYYADSAWSVESKRVRTVRFTDADGVKYGPAHVKFRTGKQVGPGKKLATVEISMIEGGLWH